MADFTADVSAFVAKCRGLEDLALRAIAAELAGRVKELTPVDTGFLRSSWIETMSPGVPIVDNPSRGASGGRRGRGASVAAETIRRLQALVPGLGGIGPAAIVDAKAGDTIYILNGASYARFVEYGTSRMAGRGMVAQTVAEAPGIARDAILRLGVVA